MTPLTQEKIKYLDGTSKVLQESQQETSSYTVNILNREFLVHLNVFSPKYFFDTEFFAQEIKVSPTDKFLEIGCGTGAVSIFAALKGAAEVTSVDINPNAVKNTKDNVIKHNLGHKMRVLEGSLYQPLNSDEKFDVIFSNTPFAYTTREQISILERATFDPNYNFHRELVAGAKQRLNPGGKLLIGYSTTLGDYDLLHQILENAGFRVELLSEIESIETFPVTFELFQATLM